MKIGGIPSRLGQSRQTTVAKSATDNHLPCDMAIYNFITYQATLKLFAHVYQL